jgi:integrase
MNWPSYWESDREKQIEREREMAPRPSAPPEKKRLLWHDGSRLRRIRKEELKKLEEACKDCSGLSRYYVPLAIYIAVETGMRPREMFELTWQDVDLAGRTIQVPSEADARTIVLPFMSKWYLTRVMLALEKERRFYRNGMVFPIERKEFNHAYSHAAFRAGSMDLTFLHLRSEASFRFREAGLTVTEHGLMMSGGANVGVADFHLTLKSIQDKLDRHSLGGLTAQEADGKIPLIDPAEIIEVREWMMSEGLMKEEKAGPNIIRHFPFIVLHCLEVAA